MQNAVAVTRSVILFVLAGICEIGGGWLIWKWLRDHKPGWWGLLGGLILILYGVIPTLQASHFGRVYAVYGGFFIVLSLLWGWGIDGSDQVLLSLVQVREQQAVFLLEFFVCAHAESIIQHAPFVTPIVLRALRVNDVALSLHVCPPCR